MFYHELNAERKCKVGSGVFLTAAPSPNATPVAPMKPLAKFLCIKAIVFLTFWYVTFVSFSMKTAQNRHHACAGKALQSQALNSLTLLSFLNGQDGMNLKCLLVCKTLSFA